MDHPLGPLFPRGAKLCRDRAALVLGVFVLALAIASNGIGQAPASKPASDWPAFQKTVLPFLAKHCFECHTDKKSGDVRLDQFQDDKSLAKGLATLDRVQVMLRKQAMPPKKRPQPGAERRQAGAGLAGGI